MGYTTEFAGTLAFSRELSASELLKVKDILSAGDGDELAAECGYVRQSGEQFGYIDLELAKDFSGVQYNGNEKTYHMVEDINVTAFAIGKAIPGVTLTGRLLASGEERGDIWAIDMRDGRAVRTELDKPQMICCPDCHSWFVASEAETK